MTKEWDDRFYFYNGRKITSTVHLVLMAKRDSFVLCIIDCRKARPIN